MSFRKRYLIILSISVLFLLAACEQTVPTPLPEATADDQDTATTPEPPATSVLEESGYPEPEADAAPEEDYPAPPTRARSIGYPPPSATEPSAYPAGEEDRGGSAGPLFRIEPSTAGDTTVSGTAPFNLELAVMDVTLGGSVLGTTQSDEEGNFSVTVPPLAEGHRIGITILSQDASESMEALAIEYFPYRGDNFMNIPNIGVFFDTTLVSP